MGLRDPEKVSHGTTVQSLAQLDWCRKHALKIRVSRWAGVVGSRTAAVLESHLGRKQGPRRNWMTGVGNEKGFGHYTDISV